MPIDRKYGRVTLEHGIHIPDDEPVIVFRASDLLAVKVLGYYLMLCARSGSPRRHLGLVIDNIEIFRAWQAANVAKVPDSETSRAWLRNGHE